MFYIGSASCRCKFQTPTTMSTAKPIFRCILILILFLFVNVFASVPASTNVSAADDDPEEFEALLALDEAEEEEEEDKEEIRKRSAQSHVKSSGADVLSKAQKIVLELNNDDTKKVLDGNEFVLVLGYAPWCSRSAELMPQFAEAATSLKELGSSIIMAKVDGDRYPRAASLLGIKGFPTLLLFINGSSQAYTGGFTSDDIVIWARKKIGIPIIRLSTITGANEFLRKHKMFLVGLFKKFEGPQYEEYALAATFDNEVQFVEVSETEIVKVLFPEITYNDFFIGLVKSEPERYAAYEGVIQADRILEFLDYNKFPLVNILTELNYGKVYSSPIKLQVLVFAKPDDFRQYLVEPFQDVARKFKKQILFIYVDIRDDNLAKPYLTLFGLEEKESEKPVVIALDNNIKSKYMLGADPTSESIEEFCLGFLQGTLPPYFKSQTVPDNANASVLIIVGSTFDELVLDNEKNVLLEVHVPWCVDCEALTKKMEKLAKHFKRLDSLIFARIDGFANEHPTLQVNDFPALLFYPAGNKSYPVKLSSKSGLKELGTFLNKNSIPLNETPKDEL